MEAKARHKLNIKRKKWIIRVKIIAKKLRVAINYIIKIRKMELYTFIMDYIGGTYISQIKAPNELEAMRLWIRNLEIKEIEGFSIKDKNKLIETDIDGESPTLIKGLENVWHFLINTKKGFGYINFVKTKIGVI